MSRYFAAGAPTVCADVQNSASLSDHSDARSITIPRLPALLGGDALLRAVVVALAVATWLIATPVCGAGVPAAPHNTPSAQSGGDACANNHAPVAALQLSDFTPAPGDPVSFDASASYDPDSNVSGLVPPSLLGDQGLSSAGEAGLADGVQGDLNQPPPAPPATRLPVPPGHALVRDSVQLYRFEIVRVGAEDSTREVVESPQDSVLVRSYTELGLYNVQLTVEDACGATASVAWNFEVCPDGDCDAGGDPPGGDCPPSNLPPLAAVVCDACTNGIAGKALLFSGSGSSDPDGEIVDWVWDFGDGSPLDSNGPLAAHEYQTPGSYSVVLHVTDSCGAVSSNGFAVTVNLTPDFWYLPSTVKVGETAAFHAYAPLELINSYRWSFSDGGVKYGKDITRPFNYAGNLTATLRLVTKTGQVIYSAPQPVVVQADPGLRLVGLVPGSRGEGWDIAIVGSIAWLVSSNGGQARLLPVDASPPSAPTLRADVPFAGYAFQVAASSSIVAVAASCSGLYLFDATQPDSPVQLHNYNTWEVDGTRAMGVAQAGAYVYLASELTLNVLDVSVPDAPVLVDSQPVLANCRLAVENGRLYLGSWPGGQTGSIRVYALTDPSSPVFLGELPTSKRPFDLAVRGNLVFATERNTSDLFEPATIAVFDLTSGIPTEPRVRIGTAATTYRTIAVGTSVLYATSSSALVTIDISDIDNPLVSNVLPIQDIAAGIRLSPDGGVLAGLSTNTLGVFGD